MANNEKTSDKLASLASKAMRDPGSLTKAEIRSLGATGLTQAKDKPKPAPKSPPKGKR
jgi:hypothetical protein